MAPGARIIAILREPASFLHSLHLQLLQNRLEDEKDLARAIALEPQRREGRRIPASCYRPQALLYSERVRYVEQLRRYHEVFAPEQMLVLIYDDFRDDNAAAVRSVLRFLAVDEDVELPAVQANPSVAVRSLRLDALRHRLGGGAQRSRRGPRPSLFAGAEDAPAAGAVGSAGALQRAPRARRAGDARTAQTLRARGDPASANTCTGTWLRSGAMTPSSELSASSDAPAPLAGRLARAGPGAARWKRCRRGGWRSRAPLRWTAAASDVTCARSSTRSTVAGSPNAAVRRASATPSPGAARTWSWRPGGGRRWRAHWPAARAPGGCGP